jgi:acyl-CoA reductase-like NAD-dependent aldehyde dehydrogenase
MKNQTHQDKDNAEQPSTQRENALATSETLTIRRPPAGSVVIIAPWNTGLMHVGTADFVKLELRLKLGE